MELDMLDKLDKERGKSFFLWHTFYSTGLLGLDKTPSQTTWKLRVEHKSLHVFWLLTQKTEDRIVCGETSASSRPSMDRPLLRRRLRELCCGMDPIHPTAPTSSFSSSYCWYWSPEHSKYKYNCLCCECKMTNIPVPRCWHEVSMLLMHGFATPANFVVTNCFKR